MLRYFKNLHYNIIKMLPENDQKLYVMHRIVIMKES